MPDNPASSNAAEVKQNLGTKKVNMPLFIILAILLICQVPAIVQGFFLTYGLEFFLGLPLAFMCLIFLLIHGITAIFSKRRIKFLNRGTAVAILIVLWAIPIMPIWNPILTGYYLRVKTLGDIPAIMAWADSRRAASTQPISDEREILETLDDDQLPAVARLMGHYASIRSDGTVSILAGGGFFHWGLVVGRGIASKDEAERGWKVGTDAYLWADKE